MKFKVNDKVKTLVDYVSNDSFIPAGSIFTIEWFPPVVRKINTKHDYFAFGYWVNDKWKRQPARMLFEEIEKVK